MIFRSNILGDGEVSRQATAEESSVVQTKGGREVRRTLALYNLGAILAEGYLGRSLGAHRIQSA